MHKNLLRGVSLSIILSTIVSPVFASLTIQKTAAKKTSVKNNTADFFVPLQNSLTPARGYGSPTYSRPDTTDYTATVTDWENRVIPVLKNEARFTGARRVQNLLKNSDLKGTTGLGNLPTSWTVCGVDYNSNKIVSDVSSPVSNYSVSIRETSGGGYQGIQQNVSWEAGKKYVLSFYVRVPSGVTASNLTGFFNMIYPDTTLVPAATLNAQPKDVWVRYSRSFIYPTTTTNILCLANENTPVGNGFDITAPQLEMVEGQSNQNPSEYVSTGVTGGPQSHGQTTADGVQYFSTKNGNTVNGSNKVIAGTGAFLTPSNGASSITTDDGGPKGYLAEGGYSNIIKYSERFDNVANWLLLNGTPSVTADTTVAPDGKMTADTLTNASTTHASYFYQWFPVTTSSNTPMTFSVYIKSSAPTIGWGGASQVTGGTETITDAGNGWYRHMITGSSSIDNPTQVVPQITVLPSTSIIAWGAHLELLPHASSYIPTTNTQVARASDSLSYPFKNNINDQSGSMSIETTPEWSVGNGYSRHFTDVYGNYHSISLWHWDGYSNLLTFDRMGTTDVRNYIDGFSCQFTTNSTSKIAGTWSNQSIRQYCNGSMTGNKNTGINLPYESISGSALNIGNDYLNVNNRAAFSSLRNLSIWKKPLSDTELNNLTYTTNIVSKNATKKVIVNKSPITSQTGGLVAYYSFDGNSIKGKTIKDVSGNGNDLLFFNGTATPAIGKIGQAVRNSSFWFVSTSTPLDGTNFPQTSGTVAFWIKGNCSSQHLKDFIDEFDTSRRHIFIRCHSTDNNFQTVMQNNATYAASVVNTFRDNEWNHIVMTYNMSTLLMSVYTNGTLVSTTTISDPTWIADGQKVAPGATYGDSFYGYYDDYRIYNRDISASEVKKLYRMGR